MSTIWPFFDLSITTPRLELRLPTDAELEQLAAVALAGIHDPGWTPFVTTWSMEPSPALERGVVQFHWACRSSLTPDKWRLPLGVFVDGEIVGCQDLSALKFAVARGVVTGSWLGRHHQGMGLGTEMRATMLAFAFEHLGAPSAGSSYRDGNYPSAGVSRKLGYADDGIEYDDQQGERVIVRRIRISPEQWAAARPAELEVAVTGLDACRSLLGAEGIGS
ncbi:MAG: GNAT family N-acetyltransferase [Thermoleophilia bacterium]|nr:GNAT family N-acetyltransferase [Thermoleophilia bacterium]